MIPRQISAHLARMLQKFPVVSLTGPRQSGKTTLLRDAFSSWPYYNLERPDIRERILADPVGFLRNEGPGVIFDEAQNMPELFSYIQGFADERKQNGQYILSGSQSFLLNRHISQSLAGRVSVNHLFPFDKEERKAYPELNLPELMLRGSYPRIHDQHIDPSDFFPSYLQTYIERDIRTLRAVENLHSFSRFLGLCAGRTGQVLHLSSLANDAGIAVNTAKAWLSLLESSFIIFLLQPYHTNFSKRIIKAPKLYFLDTGIAASLLRIQNSEQLRTHYLYGALFENLVISDIIKYQVHSGMQPAVYYWRESNGVEIDCIIEHSHNCLLALEIKAGESFTRDYLRNLKLFPAEKSGKNIQKMIVYTGVESGLMQDIRLIPWKTSHAIPDLDV